MKKFAARDYMLLLIEAGILCLLLFGKWLKVEGLFITHEVTLLQIGKTVSELSNYVDSWVLIAIEIIAYGGLILSIPATVSAFIALLMCKPSELRDTRRLLPSLYIPASFAAVLILFCAVIKGSLRSESIEWVGGIFKLTSAPFFVLLLGFSYAELYKRLPDNRGGNSAKSKIGNAVLQEADVAPRKTGNCPNCGAKCREGVLYCAQCGAKLPTFLTHRCSSCGEQLAAGAKFCAYCGTPADIPDPSVRKAMMCHCPHCGMELPKGTANCFACGTPLNAQVE